MKNVSWLAIALAALVASCGGGDSRRTVNVEVRDSAGVVIVENGGVDRPLGSLAAHIADLVPPDSTLTAVPWGVAADPASGRIYAADWTGARVAVFDRTGAYVGSFGRAGGGPGVASCSRRTRSK